MMCRAILFVLLAGLTPLPLHAQGLKISGKIHYSRNTTNGLVEISSQTFEAKVLGGQYLYSVSRNNGQIFSFGSDGRDNYYLLEDPKMKAQVRPSNFGEVRNGRYPNSNGSDSALPWIAFCSADFLGADVMDGFANLPGAGGMPVAMLDTHIYKVKYDPLAGSRGLPGRLEYIINGEKLADLTNGIYETTFRPDDKAFSYAITLVKSYADFSEQVYQVEATTNCFGLVLPLKASLTHFEFRSPKKSGQKKIFEQFSVETESVEPLTALDPLPKSHDSVTNIQVGDYRFINTTNGVVFLTYFTAATGGWLTNKSDPYLQKLYHKDVAARRLLLPKWVTRKVMLAFVSAILFGAIVLALFFANWFGNRSGKSEG